jgi:endonuclease III-like uncharacterized protein
LCAFGRQNWWSRIWNIASVEDEVISGALLTQKGMGIRSLEELLKPTAFVKRKIKTLRGIFYGVGEETDVIDEYTIRWFGRGEFCTLKTYFT